MLDTPITQWVKMIPESVCTVRFVNRRAAITMVPGSIPGKAFYMFFQKSIFFH